MQRLENIRIKGRFDYNSIDSLSTEARQKLTRQQPVSLGQAARIPGVSPADVAVLSVWLARQHRQESREQAAGREDVF